MKFCSRCQFEKENFKFIRGNLNPVCRSCKDIERKIYEKEYRQKNKSKILTANKAYKQIRRNANPFFRLSNNCSRMINYALNGSKNNYSIWEFLPYSISELKIHLEKKFDSNMNWGNYGSYWHLDHIVPQSEFPYHSMNESNFQKC